MSSKFIFSLILLVVSMAAQGLSWTLPDYFSVLFTMACINAILAVSLNLVNGLSGQFSLGHAGFMAVGAYTSASVDMFLLPSWHGTPWGDQGAHCVAHLWGTLSALAGYLVGLPSLKGGLPGHCHLGFRGDHPGGHLEHSAGGRGPRAFRHPSQHYRFFGGLCVGLVCHGDPSLREVIPR